MATAGMDFDFGFDGEEKEVSPEVLRRRRLTEIAYLGSQPHILHFFRDVSEEDQDRLMMEVETLPFRELNLAFNLAYPPQTDTEYKYTAPPSLNCSDKDATAKGANLGAMAKLKEVHADVRARWHQQGLNAIGDGKIAVVLLAGGQGTRLGLNGPKGRFEIGPMSSKSLFQLFAERIATLRRLAPESTSSRSFPLQLFVMTAEHNDAETRKFFEETDCGIPKSDVHFFPQKMIPCFNKKGKMILSDRANLAKNPNGNGGVFDALNDSGVLKTMKTMGVEAIHVVGVDNALCKVADPTFIGFAMESGAEVVNKCVEKVEPSEKVGVFCIKEKVIDPEDKTYGAALEAKSNKGPTCCVVEYTELPEELRDSKNENGQFVFSGANICSHFFRLDFVRRLATSKALSRCYHPAMKVVKGIDMDEMDDHFPVLRPTPVEPEVPNAVKLELFIFDSFESAKSCVALEVERGEEFSPIKNAEGEDSPATARRMMCKLHQRWLKEAGFNFEEEADEEPKKRCEVSPLVSYEGEGLKERAPKDPVALPFYLE